MRIAIHGTGGVGGYFGAQLARAGLDVVFIARGDHLRAIQADGLTLETEVGALVIRPARAVTDPPEAGPVDAVLVCVKAWQVAEAAAAIAPMLGPETFVVPMQNGVEAADQLAAVLGADRIVDGFCGTFSWVVAPGRIRSIGASNFVRFGERDGRASDRTERLRRAFAGAGVDVQVVAGIQEALWGKFLLVTAFGGVGAVSRAPIGVLRALPETRAMLERCMVEVEALARARGIALADRVVADTMGFVDRLAPGATTSLQRDIANGKPSELEAWNGAVVRLARGASVAVPLHACLYHSLLPQELRARGNLTFPG